MSVALSTDSNCLIFISGRKSSAATCLQHCIEKKRELSSPLRPGWSRGCAGNGGDRTSLSHWKSKEGISPRGTFFHGK